MALKNLTNETFTELVKNSNGVQLVKFGADWCGPCKAVEPTLNQLSSEFQGKAEVYEINVDQEPNLARDFNVRGIPAVMIFKNGEIQETLTGIQSIEEYRNVLNKNIQ